MACGVGVGVHGEAGFCMAQDTGQRFGIHATGQRVGGEGVAQIVKPKVRQVVFRQDFFQLTVCGGRIHGRFRMEWIVKDPGGVGLLFAQLQQFHCAGRQHDGSGAGAGLGIPHHQPSALFLMERAADTQRPLPLIEVRPHEAADLTQAQTGGQFRVEEVVPDRVLFHR